MEKPLGLGFKNQKIIKTIIQEEKDEDGANIFKQIDKPETDEEYNKRINNYRSLCYKILLSFEIYMDDMQYVYFNEFLYKIYKNTFQSKIQGILSPAGKRILEVTEQKTDAKLIRKNNKAYINHISKTFYRKS